jgi:serine/threonine-protein kinase
VSAPGHLQVVVRPWGEVTVDGRVVGQTPLDRIALPPGVHRVRVRHPSFEVWEREVAIRSGETEKVVVDFNAAGVRRKD